MIEWFVDGKILHSFQELPFENRGGNLWRANAYFKYFEGNQHWQMFWIPSVEPAIFVGGLEGGNEMAFYKYLITRQGQTAALNTARKSICLHKDHQGTIRSGILLVSR